MTQNKNDLHLLDFLLTYLQCYYGAFIAIFLGMLVIAYLEIPNIALKNGLILIFWIIGLYFLMQIILTIGRIRVILSKYPLGYEPLDEVKELGVPYNWLISIFNFTGNTIFEGVDLRILLGFILYFVLLLFSFNLAS